MPMDPAVMAEAHEQALGVFADRLLKLACHLQEQAMQVEEVDQKVRLATAFHRLGRGLRQTLALQSKLARDARGEAREAPAPEPPSEPSAEPAKAPAAAPDPQAVAIARRRAWLTRGVERCVWNEYEPDDSTQELIGDSLLEDLHERLADLTDDGEAFLALDPDALLVQLCRDLGLTPPQFHPPAPPAPAGAFPMPAAMAEGAQAAGQTPVNGHDSS